MSLDLCKIILKTPGTTPTGPSNSTRPVSSSRNEQLSSLVPRYPRHVSSNIIFPPSTTVGMGPSTGNASLTLKSPPYSTLEKYREITPSEIKLDMHTSVGSVNYKGSQPGLLKPSTEESENHASREPVAVSRIFKRPEEKVSIPPAFGSGRVEDIRKYFDQAKAVSAVHTPDKTKVQESTKAKNSVTGMVRDLNLGLIAHVSRTSKKQENKMTHTASEIPGFGMKGVVKSKHEETFMTRQASGLNTTGGLNTATLNLRRISSVPGLISNPSSDDCLAANPVDESSNSHNRRSWTMQSMSSMSSIVSSSSNGSSVNISSNQTMRSISASMLSDLSVSPERETTCKENGNDNELLNHHFKKRNTDPVQGQRSCQVLKSSPIFSPSGIQRVTKVFARRDDSHGKTNTITKGEYVQAEYISPSIAFEPRDFNDKCERSLEALSCPKQKESFYVAREILSSEKTFVNTLHLITTAFPNSLESTAKRLRLPNRASIASDTDLGEILGELPFARTFNELILKDLYDRIYNWNKNTQIADIFITKGPFLKHYTHYIKDFEKHITVFDNLCKKRPNFATAVTEFESSFKQCQLMGLKSYMLKPVQRMPQYSLLLENYLKTLQEDHPDFENTKKAIQILKSVAEHANETIRTEKSFEQLMQLQTRSLDYDFLRNNSKLIKEGELQKASKKKNQPRYFVLMSDVLLGMAYANPTNTIRSSLRLRYELPLKELTVKLPSCDETSCEFSIMGRTRSFNCFAKSEKDRNEWVEALRHAIQKFLPTIPSTESQLEPQRLGNQAPLLVQDSRRLACQSCNSEFRLTLRRHHCRACGNVVCRKCSSNEAPLEYLRNHVARVCNSCYEILLNDFKKEHPKDELLFKKKRKLFRSMTVNTSDNSKRGVVSPNTKDRAEQSPSVQEAIFMNAKIGGYVHWNEVGIWERSWAVLVGHFLHFFLEIQDTTPVKTISLIECDLQVAYLKDDEDEFRCIKLHHIERDDIFLQIVNQAMAENWETLLENATIPM